MATMAAGAHASKVDMSNWKMATINGFQVTEAMVPTIAATEAMIAMAATKTMVPTIAATEAIIATAATEAMVPTIAAMAAHEATTWYPPMLNENACRTRHSIKTCLTLISSSVTVTELLLSDTNV